MRLFCTIPAFSTVIDAAVVADALRCDSVSVLNRVILIKCTETAICYTFIVLSLNNNEMSIQYLDRNYNHCMPDLTESYYLLFSYWGGQVFNGSFTHFKVTFTCKCIANVSQVLQPNCKKICKYKRISMHVSIRYCYANIRSWLIEMSRRWRLQSGAIIQLQKKRVQQCNIVKRAPVKPKMKETSLVTECTLDNGKV